MESHAQVGLTVAPGPWNAVAAAYLSAAVQPETLDGIRAQVESGAASLFFVVGETETLGAYVLRVDQAGAMREGVIVAAAGEAIEGGYFGQLLPHVLAQFRGVDAFRIHTARPGLVRKLVAAGWTPQEFVMRRGKCTQNANSTH